ALGTAPAALFVVAALRAVAVPFRHRPGGAVAAVCVATHTARRTLESCVHDVLPALRTTADRLQADLHTASRFTPVPPA
ncbi:hypothetical protein ABZX95_50685, partial [Streptomyces sp. NPDC004232]